MLKKKTTPLHYLHFFTINLFLLTAQLPADLATADRAMDDYQQKVARWEQSIAAADSPTLRQKILLDRPDPRPLTESIMREISPSLNEPPAMKALSWIYENDPAYLKETSESSPGKIIRTSLNRYHYKYPGAGELCIIISQSFHPSDMAFLEKVSTQSPIKTDQGLASLAISIALAGIGDEAELHAKRLQQLKKAITLIPEDTLISGRKALEVIEDQLYVMKNLTKGRVAPSFTGQSVGGQEISWNGPSGKVTALLFWKDQDLITQESLLPILQDTEKLLTQRGGEMKGIYTGDQEKLRSLISERAVTWENIYDASKAITGQYRIERTPTIILLNQKGEIESISEPSSLVNLSIQALTSQSE